MFNTFEIYFLVDSCLLSPFCDLSSLKCSVSTHSHTTLHTIEVNKALKTQGNLVILLAQVSWSNKLTYMWFYYLFCHRKPCVVCASVCPTCLVPVSHSLDSKAWNDVLWQSKQLFCSFSFTIYQFALINLHVYTLLY